MRKQLIILTFMISSAYATTTNACLIIANKKGITTWEQNPKVVSTLKQHSFGLKYKNTNDKIKIIWQTKQYLPQATLAAIGEQNQTQNVLVANINSKHIFWNALIDNKSFYWQTNAKIETALAESLLKVKHHLHPKLAHIKCKVAIPYNKSNLHNIEKKLQLACPKSEWSLLEARSNLLLFAGLIHKKDCFKAAGAKQYA